MAHSTTKSTTSFGWTVGSSAIRCLHRRLKRLCPFAFVFVFVLVDGSRATGQSVSGLDSVNVDVLTPSPALSPSTEWEEFPNSANARFVGSRSCASSSCHGDSRRETVVGSAAHYFFDRDKHQSAGVVLRNQRSQAIADRLQMTMPPWKSRECLVCHAPAALDSTDQTHFSAMLSEGVNCESCHGAARDWLVPHRAPEWHYNGVWSADRRASIGFVETKQLTQRVDRCADCHVGNVTQSVNHDLIAAGHPRLAFEYSAYQSRMPIHWRQSLERQQSPVANTWPSSQQSTYEARNWLIGQIVTADHELEILSTIVSRPGIVQPGLAQYDCFACHHELSSPGWRQARTAWNIRPGELPWGTWSLGLLAESQPALADILTERFVANRNSLLQELKTSIYNQDEVRRLVSNLRQDLAQSKLLLSQKHFTPDDLSAIRYRLAKEQGMFTDQGWDRSTQLFLALVALDKGANDALGSGNRVPRSREANYQRLRGLLSFSEVRNSTPKFDYRESPTRFEANLPEIKKEFEQLQSSAVSSDASFRTDGLIESIPLLPVPQTLETR